MTLRKPPVPNEVAKFHSPPNISTLYQEGVKLFGNRLQAVTVSNDQVIWHLSDTPNLSPISDQYLTLTLKPNNGPVVYIATHPGMPVKIDFGNKHKDIEFLPDNSDQVIAVGDHFYSDSSSANSLVSNVQIHKIQR